MTKSKVMARLQDSEATMVILCIRESAEPPYEVQKKSSMGGPRGKDLPPSCLHHPAFWVDRWLIMRGAVSHYVRRE